MPRLLRRLLRAVLRPSLLPVGHAGGVEGGPDDLVADSGEILHPAAPHQDDRVLLEVVTGTGDVRGSLDAAGQADASNLPKGRVRLLRGDREHARADAPALRRALERRALRLRASRLAASSNQLLRRRHACPHVAGLSPGLRLGRRRQRRRTRTAPATRSSSPASRVTEIGTRSRPNSPTESMTRLVRSCAVIRTAKVPNEPIRGGANVSTARTPIPRRPAGTQIHGDCLAASATPASDRLTRKVNAVIPISPTIAARVVAARAPDRRPIMASIVDWRTAPIPAKRTATAVSETGDICR